MYFYRFFFFIKSIMTKAINNLIENKQILKHGGNLIYFLKELAWLLHCLILLNNLTSYYLLQEFICFIYFFLASSFSLYYFFNLLVFLAKFSALYHHPPRLYQDLNLTQKNRLFLRILSILLYFKVLLANFIFSLLDYSFKFPDLFKIKIL